jgi:hypothetical protein
VRGQELLEVLGLLRLVDLRDQALGLLVVDVGIEVLGLVLGLALGSASTSPPSFERRSWASSFAFLSCFSIAATSRLAGATTE